MAQRPTTECTCAEVYCNLKPGSEMSSTAFDTLGPGRTFGSADFPGCESFHLPANELDRQ